MSSKVLIALAFVIFALALVIGQLRTAAQRAPAVDAVEIVNGVQRIHIGVKNGYTPSRVVAQAGIPTELVLRTHDTFDCSANIQIPTYGISQELPSNGETIIPLGTSTPGTVSGGCSMAMFRFTVVFE